MIKKIDIVNGRKIEEAYKRLVSELAAGKYPLNTPLPPGRELSQRYKVSHPTLRMAIRRLAEEGRLEPRHGSGVFVMPPRAASGSSINHIAFMTTSDNEFFRDVQNSAINRGLILNPYIQCRSEWNSRDERKFLEFAGKSRPLALFAFCSPIKPFNRDILREISLNGTYVVHVEPFSADILPEQNYLMPDYRRAGHMAAVRLIMNEHRKLYHLNIWEGACPMDFLVERGINEALEEHSADVGKSRHLNMLNKLEGRMDKLKDLVSGLETGAGIISSSYRYMNLFYGMAKELGRDDLGFVAIQYYAEDAARYPFDCLGFDRIGIIERIFESNFRGEMKELLSPKWRNKRAGKG